MREIFRSLSARNVAFNLAGQLLPLLVALVTIPSTISRLGADRFGLLALALTTLGVSSILDVSGARAITKFSSDALARGERERLGGIVRSGVLLQLVLGVAFAGIVFVVAPLVIARGLKVPVRDVPDACLAFRILAAAAIPNLVLGCFRGFLEAHRRFDLVNLVRGPGTVLSFLLPWIGARAGWSLAAIALSLFGARLALAVVFAAASLKVDPRLFDVRGPAQPVRALINFSGYVTASEALPASLAAWDQFLIGSLASVAAVASYSVPNELVLRLWVIPTSVVGAFFPVLSAAWAQADWGDARQAIERSAKGTLLLLAGPVLILVAGAPRLLRWWMGASFAATSSLVLQILASGMLLGSLSLIATGFLQAAGHPELTARLRLFLAPAWLFVQWKLTESFGLVGAATGVAVRSGVDAALVGALAGRIWQRRQNRH